MVSPPTPRPTRAAILAAMMDRPDGEWTRSQLADATGLDHRTVGRSADTAANAGQLSRRSGDKHSDPVHYKLTHSGRQWGIAFTT